MSKTTVSYRPTPKGRIAGLGAAFYEMQQFCNCMIWLRRPPDQAVKNALIESMLIHVRVLLDFFEAKKRGERDGKELDDILSKDFGFGPTAVGLRRNFRSRISTEVAHLSYSRAERVSEKDKAWYPAAFLPLVIECIEFIEFVNSHDEDILRRLEEFRAKYHIQAPSVAELKTTLALIRMHFQTMLHQERTATGAAR